MDNTARLGLRAKAKAIEQFMDLQASEIEWIFTLLKQVFQLSETRSWNDWILPIPVRWRCW